MRGRSLRCAAGRLHSRQPAGHSIAQKRRSSDAATTGGHGAHRVAPNVRHERRPKGRRSRPWDVRSMEGLGATASRPSDCCATTSLETAPSSLAKMTGSAVRSVRLRRQTIRIAPDLRRCGQRDRSVTRTRTRCRCALKPTSWIAVPGSPARDSSDQSETDRLRLQAREIVVLNSSAEIALDAQDESASSRSACATVVHHGA